MKLSIFFISVLFTIIFSSCKDDNPTGPSLSIIEEINNSRPYNSIFIQNADTGNWTFARNPDAGNLFNDAYAENGYFIVVTGASTHYFNLALAKQVYIYDKNITIYY